MTRLASPGQLGGSIPLQSFSVSMLTEGWTPTPSPRSSASEPLARSSSASRSLGEHCAGQSYDLNEEGLFNVEYADVFGISLRLHGKTGGRAAAASRETIQVKASVSGADLAGDPFPRVEG